MKHYALIGNPPEGAAEYTDMLMFGVCHNDGNQTIGRTVFVMRWADGTVTVSNVQINVQPT